MKRFKKYVAILLACVMWMSTMPIPVFADDTDNMSAPTGSIGTENVVNDGGDTTPPADDNVNDSTTPLADDSSNDDTQTEAPSKLLPQSDVTD